MDHVVGNLSYTNQNLVNPIGFLILVVLGIGVFVLSRRSVILPMLLMACFVSAAQRIIVLGLDFNFIRILVVCGALRLLIRREYLSFHRRPLDTWVLCWALSAIVFYTIRLATFGGFVNRMGFAFDSLGMYFLFRCWIRDWKDIDRLVQGLLWTSIPLALLFIIENRTGRNMFSIFGGVPYVTVIRQGRLRCQGAYSHAILAGCFWATILPFFCARWWKSGNGKMWAVTGSMAGLIIVMCSASSTPVLAVLCAILGGVGFYWRSQMRVIRWGVLAMLFGLHIVMAAPVWHLISRVSAVGGSTGWHRYNLIDQTIKHFSQWCVMGCSGRTVASWGVYAGDVTNQYILEGINGGAVTLCLFIGCVAVAFRETGKIWKQAPKSSYQLALSWAIGVSLFVHCANFIGVSYFGQITILWYLNLAMIGSLSGSRKAARRKSK